jgi:hypothetical protein
MVASVIANKRKPEIPVVLPTQAEVKTMKPWLSTVERFIGRFSQNWARKFAGFIESQGQQIVAYYGSRVSEVAEQIKTLHNPRQQFVTEIAKLYDHLAEPEYRMVADFFGEHQEEVKIEDKIITLLHGLKHIRDGYDHRIYTRGDYPFLTTMLPIVKFPPPSLDYDQAGIVGAELMEGIHEFLRQNEISQLISVPRAQEVSILNPGSWMRGIAETFFGDKLEKVKKGLPNILTQAHGVLPTSGPKLADGVYDIAENICILKAQGRSAEEIARHMFVK